MNDDLLKEMTKRALLGSNKESDLVEFVWLSLEKMARKYNNYPQLLVELFLRAMVKRYLKIYGSDQSRSLMEVLIRGIHHCDQGEIFSGYLQAIYEAEIGRVAKS